MKRFLLLPLLAALAFFANSCGKQQTEAERNAEIERHVQQRLAAEHQAEEQQKLAQHQAELDAREKALAERENRATPTPTMEASTRAASGTNESKSNSYSIFYGKLDPYGDWMETSDYGYVWQPHQAAQPNDWRPYINGHWVFTEAGWTWISDEPFGWATYHYGRWVRLRGIGWVWVLGDEWAPAWVSWRTSDDYVGWAPLPPEAQFDRQVGIQNWSDNYYDIGPEQYAFIPAKEFGATVTPRTVVPVDRNLTIINQTTNVTNITYNNSIIVNRGPNYDELRAHSRQPIARLRLERTQDLTNERPVIRGEVVTLPVPDLRPAERPARPARVVRTITQPAVDHGWAGIHDAQAARKTRAKMQSEATPPPNLPPKKIVRQTSPPAATATAAAAAATAHAAPIAATTPIMTPTPLPSAPPATAAEPTGPSPVENIPSLKQADLNRRKASPTVQPQKQQERRMERAQRRAEREQKMQERRGRRFNEIPPTATPLPTATPAIDAKSSSRAATPSVAPSVTPTATATATPQNSPLRKKRHGKKNDASPASSPQSDSEAQSSATPP
jgi:hypothetical protein